MMQKKEELALTLLRLMLSIIIAIHGWHRLLVNGSEAFGNWLDQQGLPLGHFIAWFITLYEIIGSVFFAIGKKRIYIAIPYLIIYSSGLLMVHLQHGWFVVGSGSNGIEYSLLLIVSIIAVSIPCIDDLKIKRN